jgi:hypothetical protein
VPDDWFSVIQSALRDAVHAHEGADAVIVKVPGPPPFPNWRLPGCTVKLHVGAGAASWPTACC